MIRSAYAVPFWYSKTDRISDEACDEIIKLGKENGLNEAGVYGATLEKGKVKKIPCVANSLVTFPNDYLHTGTTQTDEPFRYILNLNYYA